MAGFSDVRPIGYESIESTDELFAFRCIRVPVYVIYVASLKMDGYECCFFLCDTH